VQFVFYGANLKNKFTKGK